MAHVTLTDGRELDVADSDAGLLAYYRGIGASVEDVAETRRPPYTIEADDAVETPVVETVETVDLPATPPTDELQPEGKSRRSS